MRLGWFTRKEQETHFWEGALVLFGICPQIGNLIVRITTGEYSGKQSAIGTRSTVSLVDRSLHVTAARAAASWRPGTASRSRTRCSTRHTTSIRPISPPATTSPSQAGACITRCALLYLYFSRTLHRASSSGGSGGGGGSCCRSNSNSRSSRCSISMQLHLNLHHQQQR